MNDAVLQKLNLSIITVDMQILPRANGLNQKHVAEIEESYRAGKAVEPPVVWRLTDGNKGYKLGQGFHRIEAARRTGLTHLECVVMAGTELKCLIDAMCSNQGHWLKRDDPDYERIIGELHKIWPNHTDRQIAEASGISRPTVGKYRKKIPAEVQPVLSTVDNTGDAPAVPKRVGKDGRKYNATKPKPVPAADVAAETDAPPEPVKLPDATPTPAGQPSEDT